jgi:hypothetical protein
MVDDEVPLADVVVVTQPEVVHVADVVGDVDVGVVDDDVL